jgi:two-component system chemotaxis response regulator CheY
MRKILVVEDSGSTRAFVRAVLEDTSFAETLGGVEITEATCGFDAMRLLPRGHFDLIVTDLNMADINGLELIRFIRKSEHYREVPLIIISTQTARTDVDRGLALGANAYVRKPFSPEHLQTTVTKLLLPPPAPGPGPGPVTGTGTGTGGG